MKILIVDDEAIARIGIQSAIEHLGTDFCVVATASNANQAYQLALAHKPDIILMDIVMPETNGIELIHMLKDKLPLTKFIIISCLDNSEFYKQAIELGVLYYINKATFSSEELLTILTSAAKEIHRQRVYDTEDENAYHTNQYAILSDSLNYIFYHNYPATGIMKKFRAFGIDLNTHYRVITISTNTYTKDISTHLQQLVLTIVQEIMLAISSGYAFLNYDGNISVIFSSDSNDAIETFCYRVQTTIEQYFDVKLHMGISTFMDNYENIQDAFSQSRTALEKRFFSDEYVFFYICTKDGSHKQNIDKYIAQLLKKDIRYEADQIIPLITSLKMEFQQLGNPSITYCKKCYHHIAIHLLEQVTAMQNVHDNIFQERFSTIDKIDSSRSLEELNSLVLQIVKDSKELFNTQNPVSKTNVIEDIKLYIESHMDKQLFIKDIANIVYMNPAYLGRMFEKQTGKRLHDYILSRKIEIAKSRLLAGDNLSDIAESLGFSSPSHLIRIFKNITNLTPKQYIMQNKPK